MTLLPWVEINNFRGISHLRYEPKQVNLLIGRNNSGKSTILEAIYAVLEGKPTHNSFGFERSLNGYSINVHADSANISTEGHTFSLFCNPAYLPEGYGGQLEEKLIPMLRTFPEFSLDDFIQKRVLDYFLNTGMVTFGVLDGEVCNVEVNPSHGGSWEKTAMDLQTLLADSDMDQKKLQLYLGRLCRMTYGSSESSVRAGENVHIIGNYDKLFSRVSSSPLDLIELDNFVREMGLIPNVERLMENGVVYREGKETYFLPYSVHGTGFSILLNMISALRQCRDGVLLIEEPENHMHPGYLQVFVENLMLLAKKLNVQVFMTTHSYDLIEAFANYSQFDDADSIEERDLIQITRIVKRQDEHELYNYTPAEAFSEMVSMKMDLRGT